MFLLVRAGDTAIVLGFWAHDTRRERLQKWSRLRAKTSMRAREAKEMVFERKHRTFCSVTANNQPMNDTKTPSLCALLVQAVLLPDKSNVWGVLLRLYCQPVQTMLITPICMSGNERTVLSRTVAMLEPTVANRCTCWASFTSFLSPTKLSAFARSHNICCDDDVPLAGLPQIQVQRH